LRRFASTTRLALVNTLHPRGAGPTWFGGYWSRPSSSRIDYALLLRDAARAASECGPQRSLGFRLQLSEAARLVDRGGTIGGPCPGSCLVLVSGLPRVPC
jgi:hypothetical protein